LILVSLALIGLGAESARRAAHFLTDGRRGIGWVVMRYITMAFTFVLVFGTTSLLFVEVLFYYKLLRFTLARIWQRARYRPL
ncbi:MAG: hypothetical protein M3081_07990, partial [Gemmatimonadota bacterium]|nr:hypothetical protein [Gemmatimonadota bacterium]